MPARSSVGQGTRLDREHPLIAGRTGRGVAVAVIDSGVNPSNPHIGDIAGTIAFTPDAAAHDDGLDRLGHGTAVIAAIQEKAPAADIHVVRIFHDRLATTLHALVRAIAWAVEQRARLINLSLGTHRAEHATALAESVLRAAAAGAIVVAAREDNGVACYPGCLEGVLGVLIDPECPRMAVELRVGGKGTTTAAASGFARPVPGVPPERNIQGISLAVANATGMIACALESRPQVTHTAALAALVGASGHGCG